jgi:small subunit ribosomal protein S20
LANSKSALKRIRVAERRRLRNQPYRSAAKTFVRKAREAIADGDQPQSAEAVKAAVSMLDRVAGKGIIHKNNAARRKSRLMKRYNQLLAEAGSGEAAAV